jgi:hypothetical protein
MLYYGIKPTLIIVHGNRSTYRTISKFRLEFTLHLTQSSRQIQHQEQLPTHLQLEFGHLASSNLMQPSSCLSNEFE